MPPLDIIIVERLGLLTKTTVKDFSVDELYKKCKFKRPDHFKQQHAWTITLDKQQYRLLWFAKTEGKAMYENKYDLPPPVDCTLFFGSGALVLQVYDDTTQTFSFANLSVEFWHKCYERLFGGFDDIGADERAEEDDQEEDELDHVPSHYKTKSGYLKDGFVVEDPEKISARPKPTPKLEKESNQDSKKEGKKAGKKESKKKGLEKKELDKESNEDDSCDSKESKEWIVEDIESELSEEAYL